MEDKIIILKAEIFDLQIKFGVIRKELEEKLQKLNELLKNERTENNPSVPSL